DRQRIVAVQKRIIHPVRREGRAEAVADRERPAEIALAAELVIGIAHRALERLEDVADRPAPAHLLEPAKGNLIPDRSAWCIPRPVSTKTGSPQSTPESGRNARGSANDRRPGA